MTLSTNGSNHNGRANTANGLEHNGRTQAAELARPMPRMPGVLVVDDEPGVRQLLRIVLERRGLFAWMAADGQEAIDVFQRNREFIRVALLDVCMPVVDGPTTMLALRAVNPQLPCCFMTGDPGHYQPHELLALGALHVFIKPFQLSDVIQIVQRLAHGTMGKVQKV